MESQPFLIYNASAGSGKTFTLVSRYLSVLLRSRQQDAYRQILAITFTNKAVNEMKERILESLHAFAQPEILLEPSALFLEVQKLLGIQAEELQRRAGKTLHRLLHNYAYFDVLTIDKFNHRLIRTFAHDLKLPVNFEVYMDTGGLLEEAVSRLIQKAGTEPELTRYLVDFALYKADENKSWDLAQNLTDSSKILFNENHLPYLSELKGYQLPHFKQSDIKLSNAITKLRKELQELATAAMQRIRDNGIEPKSFIRESFPNFLEKIIQGDLKPDMNAQWHQKIYEEPPYGKTVKEDQKALIDFHLEQFREAHKAISDRIKRLAFYSDLRNALIPLSLINAIREEIELIKKERELLLISDFNSQISDAIKDQPAPFIYERLGEKYRHYFIDEFQDTSLFQWTNLQPLIANALEQADPTGGTGSLMIVGDAKQAIYRWRGGKAEQFINLYNNQQPFQVNSTTRNLPVNYRSRDEVVTFNNHFFSYASRVLNYPAYRELFEHYSTQQTNGREGGSVHLHFLNGKPSEINHAHIADLAGSLLKSGYNYSDLCILTRKNSDASEIADFLSRNGIPVMSSESLLLKNDRGIQFLTALMSHAVYPDDPVPVFDLLSFLHSRSEEPYLHDFISKWKNDPDSLFRQYDFQKTEFLRLPLYQAVSYAARQFGLSAEEGPYLGALLETVYNFSLKEQGSMNLFLDHWEKRKEQLSLDLSGSSDAVQIMTIHRSKGLEFPVVILPFKENRFNQINPFIWADLSDLEEVELPLGQLKATKKLAENAPHLSEQIAHAHDQGIFDDINVLYVGLTRAVERMYIVCNTEKASTNNDPASALSLFEGFASELTEHPSGYREAVYGQAGGKLNTRKEPGATYMPVSFRSGRFPEEHLITKGGSLWDTSGGDAIEKGKLYHQLLSRIHYTHDMETVLQEALEHGELNQDEHHQAMQYLGKMLRHPQLEPWFLPPVKTFNERELTDQNGVIYRPDRFVINNGKAAVIDYKTGSPSEDHEKQVRHYASLLQAMGYQIVACLVVYINEEIQVCSFS